MARRYVNGAATPVSDKVLAEAREAAQRAAEDLAEASEGNQMSDGWLARYAAAEAALRAATRRVEMIEEARAAQVERSGKRAALVKTMAPELDAMSVGLAASRDQVQAAAQEHLKALAELATAVDAHNALVAEHSASLRDKGLAESDVTPVTGEVTRHAEGWFSTLTRGNGLRVDGTPWMPVDSADLIVSGLRQVLPRNLGSGLRLATAVRLMNLGVTEQAPADGVTRPVLTATENGRR